MKQEDESAEGSQGVAFDADGPVQREDAADDQGDENGTCQMEHQVEPVIARRFRATKPVVDPEAQVGKRTGDTDPASKRDLRCIRIEENAHLIVKHEWRAQGLGIDYKGGYERSHANPNPGSKLDVTPEVGLRGSRVSGDGTVLRRLLFHGARRSDIRVRRRVAPRLRCCP